MIPVLTITGSDPTGGSGIQADIKTITAMGGHAMTALTSVTAQNAQGISHIHPLPHEVLIEQVITVMQDHHPRAIKIGMLPDANAVQPLRDEIVGCPKIVCDPGFLSTHGTQLMSDDAIAAVTRHIIPLTTLLVLRCREAERLLSMQIQTDDDMVRAATRLTSMGAEAVLLRGGHQTDGMLTALLYHGETKKFFTSRNTEGWQKHGVGAALSTAIAMRLAYGDDIPTAISRAHEYIHRQVVYAVTPKSQGLRPADLYNEFMSLVAQNYKAEHSVAYYADRLAISTRYLSKVTGNVVGKAPRDLIADYLMQEAKVLLETTQLTIQEISGKLGFSSQVAFTIFFRTQQNCTPTAYRAGQW